MMTIRLKQRSIMPGFGLSLGFTLFYLCLIVLIPLSATVWKTSTLSWHQFWHVVSSPRAMASYRLSFGASLIGASINLVFGVLVAWVLVRYEFPGKRLFDSLVDLPFALPTAVAGIALTTIYAPNGWLGKPLLSLGFHAARCRDCADVHWTAVRCADRAAGAGGPRQRAGGGGRESRGGTLANVH